MKPSSVNIRSNGEAVPAAIQFLCLNLHLTVAGGSLRGAVLKALSAHGEPLRWAIMACRPNPDGLQLTVEAILIRC